MASYSSNGNNLYFPDGKNESSRRIEVSQFNHDIYGKEMFINHVPDKQIKSSHCSTLLPQKIPTLSLMTIDPSMTSILNYGSPHSESTLSPLSNQNSLVFPPETHVNGPGPPITTGDKVKGPEGANIFIFHLPNDLTNWDLYLLFRKHGTILSVHIMVNKETGLSRGFGFVSYETKTDADLAIQLMNGFRLGNKRLKVQHKRGGVNHLLDFEHAYHHFDSPSKDLLNTSPTLLSPSQYSMISPPPGISRLHGLFDSLESMPSEKINEDELRKRWGRLDI